MNLLTPSLRRRAQIQLALAALRGIGAILLGYSVVAATILLIGRAVTEWNFANVVERSTLVLRQTNATSREAQEVNEILLAIEEIEHAFIPWTVVLTAATTAAPTGITFTATTVTNASTLRIEGQATTRDDLLAFQERLRRLPFLANVTIPFSNLLLRERINFSIEARVLKAAVPYESQKVL